MLIIRRKIGEKVVIVSPEGGRLVVFIDRRVEGLSYNIAFDGDRQAFRIYREGREPPPASPVVPAEAATGSEEEECEESSS